MNVIQPLIFSLISNKRKRAFLLFFTIPLLAFSQKSGKYYLDLADANQVKGRLKRAYKYYYKAAELDKNYFYYIKAVEAYWLSHNMDKKKNKTEVERVYNKSFGLKPWNSEGLLSRANYWIYIANYNLALRNLDSLLVRDSANVEGYILKAQIYMMKKDTTRAFSIYNEALENISDTKEKAIIYNSKGAHCYFKSYWRQAIKAYEEEIKIKGQEKFTSNCFLSSAYYYIGEKNKACDYFKRCNTKKYPKAKNEEELINNCK